MRRRVLLMTGAGIGLALFGLVFSPADRLIWNRTGSAPQGLYWLNDEPFTPGRWVVVSARSAEAQWAEDQGFVGRDWPLLKQIAGISGDEICRNGSTILINGAVVAQAREVDSMRRALPVWQGCIVLGKDKFFLLNPHPDSLDGRYFGAMERGDLVGVAIPLMISDEPDDCKAMQSDTKRCSERISGPDRARLKQWHHMPPNALSAHLFFGTLCTALRCTGFREVSDLTWLFRVHRPEAYS